MKITDSAYIIGETAFHHEGDLDFLDRLVDSFIKHKVNAVKFHLLLNLDDYFIKEHKAYEFLQKWIIKKEDWLKVIQKVYASGAELVLLCNDPESVDFCIEHNKYVSAIELHATGLNDFFLLNKSLKFEGTIILGVGGSSIEEIDYAINFLKKNGKDDILLMYGFQNYPTNYKDVNFSRMLKIKDLFQLPMGYADHTDPENENNELISALPVLYGVNVLEKHFTIEYPSKRIDHQAAISVDRISKIIDLAGMLTDLRGLDTLELSEGEKKYGDVGPMKKAIVAAKDIAEGEVLSPGHLAFKRTNESSYLKQSQFNSLIGLKAKVGIKKDSLIDFSLVDYHFQVNDFQQFNPK